MTMTSLLALLVGEPASASASSSDIVEPGSVTLPGVADLAGDQHVARLELIDLDAHLRVPDEAVLQQRWRSSPAPPAARGRRAARG
jgi:hypothetical protein